MFRTPRRALLAAVLLVLSLPLGCREDTSPFEPLPGNGGLVLAGRVLDGEGLPLGDAIVSLDPMSDGLTASVRSLLESPGLRAGAAGRRATATDAAGRFAFAEVDEGRYLVTATRDDHRAGTAEVLVPRPGAAIETTFVDVELVPTGTILGSALLENATEHPNTVVYVEGTSFVAVTDPAGNYVLSGVPVGSHDLRATHPGYRDDTGIASLVAAGDSTVAGGLFLPLETNIPPAVTLSGPIEAYVGYPVTFDAPANDKDGSVVLYEWDLQDDGDFELSGTGPQIEVSLPAGTNTVKVRVTDDDGAIGLDALVVPTFPTDPGVYVDGVNGNDGNSGLASDPLATISAALAQASGTPDSLVLVTTGTYVENLTLADGISISGGHTPGTWDPPAGPTVYTVVEGGSDHAAYGGFLEQEAVFSHLDLRSTTVPVEDNSIGMFLDNCPALRFENCRFEATDAPPGDAGTPGTPGGDGAAGSPGQSGSCDSNNGGGGGSGGSSYGCNGGAGGSGGYDTAAGAAGSSGGCSGGIGGAGGSSGSVGGPGADGQDGLVGNPGLSGAPGEPRGRLISSYRWEPACGQSASQGSSGRGGGGGGGGGGQQTILNLDGTGNGGGGGGGGGQGGGGGAAGCGGWASFAVWLADSPVTFDTCTFVTGQGGDGGDGGARGSGGTGGPGGAGAGFCSAEVGRGGNGGAGGNGGDGGRGGAGAGGPSVGIAYVGVNPATIDPTFSIGSGGAGGAGTQPGIPGIEGEGFKFDL